MTDARAFRGFRFPAEIILWAVRWYLQFPITAPASKLSDFLSGSAGQRDAET